MQVQGVLFCWCGKPLPSGFRWEDVNMMCDGKPVCSVECFARIVERTQGEMVLVPAEALK